MGKTDIPVALGQRVTDIGFAEFTVKLVTEVFDAIVAAHLRQQSAYAELVAAVSDDLSDFIQNNKDDVGVVEMIAVLGEILPPDQDAIDAGQGSQVYDGSQLSAAEARTLNEELDIPSGDAVPAGALDATAVDKIMDAVAERIAESNFKKLKAMVDQGMMRTAVVDGKVYTGLTFNASGSEYFASHSSSVHVTNQYYGGSLNTGWGLSKWLDLQASASYTDVKVRTMSASDIQTASSSIQITGGVEINFKTDYQPLNV